MIRITRGIEPEGFNGRAEKWRRQFAERRRENASITASVVWTSLRAEIRSDAEILATRFHHKCAYCESRPSHVSYPHVEHYRPKGCAEFEDQMFAWNNWLLSCGICNQEKWKHFPLKNGQPLLLNPTDEDPEPHTYFLGAKLRGVSEKGKTTVELLDLDRLFLREERETWLNLINSLLILTVQAAETHVRGESRDHLIWAMQNEAPFAGMTRAYLSAKCPKLAHPAVPHARLEENDRFRRMQALVERFSEELQNLE